MKEQHSRLVFYFLFYMSAVDLSEIITNVTAPTGFLNLHPKFLLAVPTSIHLIGPNFDALLPLMSSGNLVGTILWRPETVLGQLSKLPKIHNRYSQNQEASTVPWYGIVRLPLNGTSFLSRHFRCSVSCNWQPPMICMRRISGKIRES